MRSIGLMNNIFQYTSSFFDNHDNAESMNYILSPSVSIPREFLVRHLKMSVSDISNSSIIFNFDSFDLYNQKEVESGILFTTKSPEEFEDLSLFNNSGENRRETGIPLKFRKIYFSNFNLENEDNSIGNNNRSFAYFLSTKPVTVNSGDGVITSQYCQEKEEAGSETMMSPSESQIPINYTNRLNRSRIPYEYSGLLVGSTLKGLFESAPDIEKLTNLSLCSFGETDFINEVSLHAIITPQNNSNSLCGYDVLKRGKLLEFSNTLLRPFNGLVADFGAGNSTIDFVKLSIGRDENDRCELNWDSTSINSCPCDDDNSNSNSNNIGILGFEGFNLNPVIILTTGNIETIPQDLL